MDSLSNRKFLVCNSTSKPFVYGDKLIVEVVDTDNDILDYYLGINNIKIPKRDNLILTNDIDLINTLLNVNKLISEKEIGYFKTENDFLLAHVSKTSFSPKLPINNKTRAIKKALQMVNKNYRVNGFKEIMSYYICPVCNHYHIGRI